MAAADHFVSGCFRDHFPAAQQLGGPHLLRITTPAECDIIVDLPYHCLVLQQAACGFEERTLKVLNCSRVISPLK